MAKMDCYSVREKYYSDIPMTEFERVVSFDPTRKDGKMGLYSKYLPSLYRKGFSDAVSSDIYGSYISPGPILFFSGIIVNHRYLY